MRAARFTGVVSVMALLGAVAVAWLFFVSNDPAGWPLVASERERITAEIQRLVPCDPLLTSRLAAERMYVALDVARHDGEGGLHAIDLFGDDAVYLFEKHHDFFQDLVAITELDGELFATSTGPWRQAVVQWAMAGKLRYYLEFVRDLSPDDRQFLRATPGCLPLLRTCAPIARRMLARHGPRAWQLFMLVNFADGDTQGVERVAQALEVHGDLMLRLNEQYGLAVALLLVPSKVDADSAVPRLFEHAIEMLGVEEAAALFLSNYDDIEDLLLHDARPEEYRAAIALLAGQADEVRALASDSSHIFRLLLERRGNEPIGVQAFANCGPRAADLLYSPASYSSEPATNAAALLILKHEGWAGLELLAEFQGLEQWSRLLSRIELHQPYDDPQLAKIVRQLLRSTSKQDLIERFNKMPREQIENERFPPTRGERALEWVPGYIAFKVARDASMGHHLENSEIAFAVFDGVTTVFLVGEVANAAVKTVGKGGTVLTREVAEQVERKAVRRLEEQSLKKLPIEGSKLAVRELLLRLPGATLAFIKSMPQQVLKVDVTQIMRSADGIAKRLGLRTWGRLDRRIIMRGDRVVVLDLMSPGFADSLGKAASQEFAWNGAGYVVGEAAPCILEWVIPHLRTPSEKTL